MTDDVLPAPTSGSALLRVQGTSRLAFGATTAALVTLASGGTALLVNQGASSMTSPTALPAGSILPDSGSAFGAIVVDRAAGSFGAKPVLAKTAAKVTAPVDATVAALRKALGQRPQPGKRTLTVPLVPLDGAAEGLAAAAPRVLDAPHSPRVHTPRVVKPVFGPVVPTTAVSAPKAPAQTPHAVSHPVTATAAPAVTTGVTPTVTASGDSSDGSGSDTATVGDGFDPQQLNNEGDQSSDHEAGKQARKAEHKAEHKAAARAKNAGKHQREGQGHGGRGRHAR